MKKIDVSTPTYPNKFALVDDDMFEELNQWKWTASKDNGTFYAGRMGMQDGKYQHISMHRVIVKADKGKETDHRDGNGLHNWRQNLRSCTTTQNQGNRKLNRNNKSGYKGVVWHRRRRRWQAKIGIKGKRVTIGDYFCIVKAAKAYDASARKYFGDFARVNFPEESKGGE